MTVPTYAAIVGLDNIHLVRFSNDAAKNGEYCYTYGIKVSRNFPISAKFF